MSMENTLCTNSKPEIQGNIIISPESLCPKDVKQTWAAVKDSENTRRNRN